MGRVRLGWGGLGWVGVGWVWWGWVGLSWVGCGCGRAGRGGAARTRSKAIAEAMCKDKGQSDSRGIVHGQRAKR